LGDGERQWDKNTQKETSEKEEVERKK